MRLERDCSIVEEQLKGVEGQITKDSSVIGSLKGVGPEETALLTVTDFWKFTEYKSKPK